ncbi:MAG: hypoxanthine phosphoribosyltransferase, partial [Bauldia litoralis]
PGWATRPLHTEAEIEARVDALADAIAARLGDEFVIVSILNGAFLFTADLVRALGRRGCRPRVEFITLKSYGDGLKTSGDVRLAGVLPERLDGLSVLLVDDILDSGRTLMTATSLLGDRGAASVSTCVLLDKPARREVPVSPDFTGFSIGDVFVVGYGIDYAEQYRYLPYLGYVEATGGDPV